MKNQNIRNPYFYTVIAVSVLTVALLVSADNDIGWDFAVVWCGFLLYIPLLFVKNRIFQGMVIAAEYLFMSLVFLVIMALIRYAPGEQLGALTLFIVHSFLRLYIFLKIAGAGNRYALVLGLTITLLLGIAVYGYGSTDYLKLM